MVYRVGVVNEKPFYARMNEPMTAASVDNEAHNNHASNRFSRSMALKNNYRRERILMPKSVSIMER
jgi:hypothetical protein